MFLKINNKNLKKGLLPFLAIFMFIFFLSACESSQEQEANFPELIYMQLKEEKISLRTELPGRVSALLKAEVRPQVDGIIQERLYEEGAEVLKGQVLYQIDPALYQASYNTAKAVLEEAEANVVALRQLENRYRRLVKTKSISQQELDNAIASHGEARARIARAKAELETAAINLAYTKIKAPVSGRIGRSAVTPGALVTANQHEALAVIHQTDEVYVDISQSSAEMLRLRRALAQRKITRNGDSAFVYLKLEDGSPYILTSDLDAPVPERVKGRMLFSEIAVEQSTGRLTVRAVFPNPDGILLPGMYVKAEMEEGVLEKGFLIPQGSVMSDGYGGHFIYLLEKRPEKGEGIFETIQKPVLIERALGNQWIIRTGIKTGDLLVIEGFQKTRSGNMVKAKLSGEGHAPLASKGPSTNPSTPTGPKEEET